MHEGTNPHANKDKQIYFQKNKQPKKMKRRGRLVITGRREGDALKFKLFS